MNFQKDQNVTIIDTTLKPAGSAVILSYNPFTRYYKVQITYFESGKQEEIEVPEHRILASANVPVSL